MENIHSAKKLNSCKARIFTRFNFILSYHPGSCSIKADVLFQQLQNWEDPVKCASSILHFSSVLAKLIWEAEECVKAAMGAHQWAPVVPRQTSVWCLFDWGQKCWNGPVELDLPPWSSMNLMCLGPWSKDCILGVFWIYVNYLLLSSWLYILEQGCCVYFSVNYTSALCVLHSGPV